MEAEASDDGVDASESDEPSSAFRVSVDLTRLYRRGADDPRSRCYVCVWGARRRRVRWLQARLRRLLTLPPLRLLAAGHLLPPQESLLVLRPQDHLQAIPADDILCSDSDHPSVGRDHIYSRTRPKIWKVKKRKHVETNVDEDISITTRDVEPASWEAERDESDVALVTATLPLPSPRSAPAAPDGSAQKHCDEELQRLKKHALALLDEYVLPPRPRARRRRRRPRAAPSCSMPLCTTAPARPPSPVLRNTSEERRGARLVRSLSPAHPVLRGRNPRQSPSN